MADISDVNGVTVISERIPFFRSVSFGVWVMAGSRDESEEKSGLFHFLEHLVFKGTPTRSASDIAREIDDLGGNIDAYTSRELTCFSGRVLAERLPQAFELVADIMLNPTFPEDEVERERRVILEEIRMGEDNPSDYIHDRLYPAMWGGHPLGRLITGVDETVKAVSREDLLAARDVFYRPPRIIVTACGGVERGVIEELARRYFGGLESSTPYRVIQKPDSRHGVTLIEKPLEQTHLLLAVDAPPIGDDRRNDLAVLNMILGGGVSSRLFQKVREEQGLAYSIYSFYEQYTDTGLFGVYAACAPDALEAMWETVSAEIKAIAKTPPGGDETRRAQDMGADNIKMAFESIGYRMSQMAHQKIYHDRDLSLEVMLKELYSVTPERIGELAESLLGEKNYTIIALGPVGEKHARALADRAGN